MNWPAPVGAPSLRPDVGAGGPWQGRQWPSRHGRAHARWHSGQRERRQEDQKRSWESGDARMCWTGADCASEQKRFSRPNRVGGAAGNGIPAAQERRDRHAYKGREGLSGSRSEAACPLFADRGAVARGDGREAAGRRRIAHHEHPLADLDWAVQHLLQYGPEVEVLGPAEVREALVRRLESISMGSDSQLSAPAPSRPAAPPPRCHAYPLVAPTLISPLLVLSTSCTRLPQNDTSINLDLLTDHPQRVLERPRGRLVAHQGAAGGVRAGPERSGPRRPGDRVLHLPAADPPEGAPGPEPHRHLREDGSLPQAAPGRARAGG